MGFLGLLLLIYPLWRIFRRAGLPPALSLLVAIPYVGMLAVCAILAFIVWPNLRQGA